MAESYADGEIEVEGCTVHYITWGSAGRPGVVFVHGGGAHAHWWAHIAPHFVGDYRVAAIDLSGHGDSGHRPDGYDMGVWAQEIMAVAEAAGIEGSPVLVGHSMGGRVVLATAAKFSHRLAGVMILDSPVRRPDEEMTPRGQDQFSRAKVHPDWETAIRRFRTVPEQTHYEPYLMEYIARMSLKEVEGGVTWKFDLNRHIGGGGPHAAELLSQITCRVALLRSEFGLVTADIGDYMYNQLGRVAPVIEVPLAGHHMMLDQPLLLVTALRTLLADWEHSVPYVRR